MKHQVQAIITQVTFDHDGELSVQEATALENGIIGKTFTFDGDDFCNVSSVADAISDETGWCVLDLDYDLKLVPLAS